MTISRSVIEDLIPVYLSGDASADTRQLVEEYASEHPEIRAVLRQDLALPQEETMPADLGVKALKNTRQMLDRRNSLLIWATAMSFGVFSFVFKDRELQFLLFRDAPVAAWVLLGASAVLYGLFYITSRRLVVTGLGAPHSRLAWGGFAALASVPFTVVASAQTGWELTRDFAVVAAFAGIAMAESLNRAARATPADLGR